jgi:hypothetical protein
MKKEVNAVILRFPLPAVRVEREHLRILASREARRVAKYGWRPSKRNLAQLKASTRDAVAYRTMLRAWRSAGFKTGAIRRLAGRTAPRLP